VVGAKLAWKVEQPVSADQQLFSCFVFNFQFSIFNANQCFKNARVGL